MVVTTIDLRGRRHREAFGGMHIALEIELPRDMTVVGDDVHDLRTGGLDGIPVHSLRIVIGCMMSRRIYLFQSGRPGMSQTSRLSFSTMLTGE